MSEPPKSKPERVAKKLPTPPARRSVPPASKRPGVPNVPKAPSVPSISSISSLPKAPNVPRSVPAVAPKGLSFGFYEVVGRIGSERLGEKFVCQRAGATDLVAVRVLSSVAGAGEPAEERLRDARRSVRLQHASVPKLIEVGTTRDGEFFASQYVPGRSLSSMFQMSGGDRSTGHCIGVILDVLGALTAAAGLRDDEGRPAPLVHGGVSPLTVWVGSDGGGRLMDYGVARAVADRADGTAAAGVVNGHAPYQSPEQVQGLELDVRSDIFSVGVLLWNALTGKRLFDGARPHATHYNVLRRQIPAPSAMGRKPPAVFDAVCLKALSRSPDARYQSADRMATDLRAAAELAGGISPPAEIAEWLASLFGGELQSEKEALAPENRGTARSSGEPLDLISSLASPDSPSPTDCLGWAELEPTVAAVPASVVGVTAESGGFPVVPGPALAAARAPVVQAEAAEPPVPSGGAGKWVMVAVAAVALLGGGVMAMGVGEDDKSESAVTRAPKPAAAAEPHSVESGEKIGDEFVPAAAEDLVAPGVNTAADAAAAAAAAEDDGSRGDEAEEAAAETDTAEPAPKAARKAAPKPKGVWRKPKRPAVTDDFGGVESNPYLK